MEEKTRKRNKDAVARLKCTECGKWFDHSLDDFPKECPYCHKPIRTMTCNRCGKTWYLRRRQYPKVCANLKCKSPYYNRPYLYELKEKKEEEKRKDDDVQGSTE